MTAKSISKAWSGIISHIVFLLFFNLCHSQGTYFKCQFLILDNTLLNNKGCVCIIVVFCRVENSQ